MRKQKSKNTRIIIQIIMLTTVIISAINYRLAQLGKSITWISEATFHYICPTCGITSIYQFLTAPTLWVDKIKTTLGITIGISIILAIVFGPVLCGFICPFGAIQDLVAKIGKKLFKGNYNKFIPSNLDDKLKYLRYVMLIGTVILTASSGVALIESLNPYHAFLVIFDAKPISLIGLLILCLIILASLFIQRPWCKYLCPYGAFLGIFNKFKVFRVAREKSSCINCKKCDKQCSMGIEVHSMEVVRDIRCISCLECVDQNVCPKANTIYYTSKDIQDEEVVNEI